MGRGKSGKGTVNGESFKNWRQMVWLIIQNFLKNNPNITFEEFTSDIGKYNIYSINENKGRSLIKSKESYERFPEYKNKYCDTPIIFEGKEYYFKTEVGDEKVKFFDFAKVHGIDVKLDEDKCGDNQAKCLEKNEVGEEDYNIDIKEDDSFKLCSIADLSGKTFYIPDYQRGYRWIDEVAYFVSDLVNVKEKNGSSKYEDYLFQPLVVKKIMGVVNYEQELCYAERKASIEEKQNHFDGEVYELIDGQQRLTTLFLVLSSCGQKPNFSILYERKRSIDNIYINLAIKRISDEVKNKQNDLYKRLSECAKFIWYETTSESKVVFQNINAGKTELTSAELFKALLINIDYKMINQNTATTLLAYQFDEVETGLNDEGLWSFISNEQELETRIDYLLNIYFYGESTYLINNINCANKTAIKNKISNMNKVIDKKYSFLMFNYLNEIAIANPKDDFLKKFNVSIEECWGEIYDRFEIIKSWYSNYLTHNLVGYLLSCKGKSKREVLSLLSSLFVEYKSKPFDEFIRYLYEEVCNVNSIRISGERDGSRLIKFSEFEPNSASGIVDEDDIKYDTDRVKCYNLLLLTNVIPAINSHINFDFKHLKDKFNVTMDHKVIWDIEHINSQDVKKNIVNDYYGTDEFKLNAIVPLQFMLNDSENNISDDNKEDVESLIEKYNNNNLVNDKSLFDKVDRIWNEYVDMLPDTDNHISNIALLSSDINRSYHNDFFGLKSMKIKKMDDMGLYIPITTKRVFYKSLSGCNVEENYMFKWTSKDQQAYRDYINKILSFIDEKRKDINYQWKEED